MLSAIIPAAGKGTRLKPLTDYIPKELLILKDKPIIGYILDALSYCGIKDVCVIVGHKKGEIIDYIKDGSEFNVDVCYVYQKDPLGLGHAVMLGKRYIKNKYFMVFLGDTVIIPFDSVKNMIEKFKKNYENIDGIIMVEKVNNPERFGVVKFNKEFVIEDVYEKPQEEEIKKKFEIGGNFYAISGVYIFHENIFDYIKRTPPGKNNEIQLTDAIKSAIEDGKKFLAHIQTGIRLDIGTYESYLEAQKKILEWCKEYE